MSLSKRRFEYCSGSIRNFDGDVMSKLKIKKDLTGKKFGRLTVIEQAEDHVFLNGKKAAQWLCKCDCGNYITVLGNNLTRNHTRSCGCLQREKAAGTCKGHKKYNTYDLSGEYGIGYTSKGEEFYFDLEDYDKIKDFCWYINNQGYVATRHQSKNSMVQMHRLIMGFPSAEFVVDHKRGNKTKHDNRKENLRIATRSQNAMNKGLISTNKSGVTGVVWDRRIRKWVAQIEINGKNHKKCFDYFNDAILKRKEWEEEFYKEFSYGNSQSN